MPKTSKESSEFNVELLSKDEITASIDTHAASAKAGVEGFHADGIQCLLHFQKHGDTSLMLHLIDKMKGIPGVVWQGQVQWFRKYSPVNFEMKEVKDAETGETSVVISANKISTDDPNYKPFNLSGADEAPALKTREVRSRTDREFVKPDIKFFKRRVQGMLKQIDRYTGNSDVPPEDRMSAEEVLRTRKWCEAVINFGQQYVIPPIHVAGADTQGRSREEVQGAKRDEHDAFMNKADQVQAA